VPRPEAKFADALAELEALGLDYSGVRDLVSPNDLTDVLCQQLFKVLALFDAMKDSRRNHREPMLAMVKQVGMSVEQRVGIHRPLQLQIDVECLKMDPVR
jgi:hypothetical protein